MSANYNQFPEVALNVIVGEYDVFLDDSVSLCKKWKGDVTFDVMPGLCHGFLYFNLLSSDCKNASDFCVSRLKDALKLETLK